MARQAAVTRSAVPSAKKVAAKVGPTKNVGSANWVKMAGSIESALTDMRAMYECLKALRDFHVNFKCQCSAPCVCARDNQVSWEPLLQKTVDVANRLKSGLKARVYE